MDIEKRADIELLVNTFYEKVKRDEVIGFIFNDIVKLNWERHLPIMYNFWDTILLDAANYYNNTMGIHFEINRKVKLNENHFKRWIALFSSTVDELFKGEKATLAKKRAVSIANVMLLKMNQQNEANPGKENTNQ
jgi:hemoglobin